MPFYWSTTLGKTTLKKRLLKTIKNLITSGVVSPSGGLENEKPISVVLGETKECVTVVMESDVDWKPQHDQHVEVSSQHQELVWEGHVWEERCGARCWWTFVMGFVNQL